MPCTNSSLIFLPESQSNSPSMNETPPIVSASTAATDHEPIHGAGALIDALLRQPRRVARQLRGDDALPLIVALLVVTVIFSLIYGIIVGSFSGGMQWWAAPVKIALGTTLAAAVCLPSLYIFASLSGSSARLREVTGALAGLLALLSLLLLGFAPVAWLFSQSTASVMTMGCLHLIFWLVAAIFGVRFLMTAFGSFGLESRAGLRTWVVIFLLVSLQMSTALRPLVGTADTFLPTEKKFFLAHWTDSGSGH